MCFSNSVVSIRSTTVPSDPKNPLRVNVERWCSVLAIAMTTFFDCQAYNSAFRSGYRVDWCFYGVYFVVRCIYCSMPQYCDALQDWQSRP
jgi:hypothetical protein